MFESKAMSTFFSIEKAPDIQLNHIQNQTALLEAMT